MNHDWNFEPDDDECENCLEECECDDGDDWEVYDDDLESE